MLRFGLLAQVQPFAMEHTVAVDALVGVCTEVIPLRLEQIRWQSSESITVVVCERRRECWNGEAEMACCHDHGSPRRLSLLDGLGEVWEKKQVFKVGLSVEGFFDPIEELSADDATTAP